MYLDPAETLEQDEAAMIEEVLVAMRRILAKKYGDRPQLRGAHAKSHGVFRATFTPLADLDPALRHGVLAGGRRPALIRASSTPDVVVPDRLPNIRGLALKVLEVEGASAADGSPVHQQDFVLITANIVPFGTVRSFRDMILAYADGKGLSWFNDPEGPRRAAITHEIVATHTTLLGLTFHSSTPYRLGPHVVKLRVRPVRPVLRTSPHPTDHLRKASEARLRDRAVTLELAIQRQRNPVDDPVEDASVNWGGPFEPVAHVEIGLQEVHDGENLKFDPWNSLPEHRPLGGLNRIRAVVYHNLARERVASSDGPKDCLPADDPSPAVRAAGIDAARQTYVEDREKLAPLVMCGAIPDEARPGLGWLLTAGKVSSAIAMNVVANKLADAGVPPPVRAQGQAELARLKALAGVMEEAAGRLAAGMPEMPPALPPLDELRRMVDERVRGVLTGAMGEALAVFEEDSPIYLYRSPDPDRRGTTEEHAALYRELPPSPAVEELDSEVRFARRRLTGPNAPLLRATEEAPATDLDAAAGEGRLFVCDYRWMAEHLEPKPSLRLPLPAAYFVERGGQLAPAVIVDGAAVVRPGEGDRWSAAKYRVECADMICFEAVTHLGHAHLLIEPVALATARNLAPNHPIARLLLPHVEGTLSVNDMAVYHLLADGGAVDQTFAATMGSIRGLAARAMIDHDLRRDRLTERLARQRLDRLENPYREDSLRVHGAISRWVSAYLAQAYPTQAALAEDHELSAWAAALQRPATDGGVTGFGAIAGREDLALVLTELIYTASAGHASVNFPQWTDASFAPRMSGACWGESLADLPPPLVKSELHAEFLYLLGTLYYTRLGEYRWPDRSEKPWFRDRVVREALLPAFQADLARVESDIADANRRRTTPYEHLSPTRIPQSINV